MANPKGKTEATAGTPNGISAEEWSKLTPEAQAAISAAFAKAAAAESKYSAKPRVSKSADGRYTDGVGIAYPSYLTAGAAAWTLTDEGQAAIKAALADLADPVKAKALRAKADENRAKADAKAKA